MVSSGRIGTNVCRHVDENQPRVPAARRGSRDALPDVSLRLLLPRLVLPCVSRIAQTNRFETLKANGRTSDGTGDYWNAPQEQ